MGTAFKNSEQVVAEYSNKWAIACRSMLEIKRPRTSIRAKWKKVGAGWEPVGPPTKKTFRGNYVASGQLVNSIQAAPKGLDIGIKMARYGEAIVLGRAPMGKSRGGKGIPLDSMRNWTKMKRIQPRDLSTGKFKSNATAESMRYLMNRKIKHFGIEPFPFVTMARQEILPSFNKALSKAMATDIKSRFKR